MAIAEVRGIVERVCARPDVPDACARRDLGPVIAVLNAHGVTQGQIAELTGILQGRLSEYARRKRVPTASRTFEAFAGGLGMPAAARQALGLAAEPSGSPGISLAHSQRAPDLDAGLEYPGTPAQAAGNVSMLWRADLADQGVLERGLITPAAWNDASLRWLVDPAGSPGTGADALGGVRVGIGDVERFRATVEMFAQLDDRFGGGHARQSLIQYLSSVARSRWGHHSGMTSDRNWRRQRGSAEQVGHLGQPGAARGMPLVPRPRPQCISLRER